MNAAQLWVQVCLHDSPISSIAVNARQLLVPTLLWPREVQDIFLTANAKPAVPELSEASAVSQKSTSFGTLQENYRRIKQLHMLLLNLHFPIFGYLHTSYRDFFS